MISIFYNVMYTMMLIVFFITEVSAQQNQGDELHFGLEGAYRVDGDRLIINRTTGIRFFRNSQGKEQTPANIHYRIDGSEPVVYTGPFKIAAEGSHIIHYAEGGNERPSISLVVDVKSPVVDVSIVYKSITLKSFQFTEKTNQNGTNPLECPLGAELRVSTTDDISGVSQVLLKEGGASLQLTDGMFELRSRGNHSYTIMASDLVHNVIETAQIRLYVIEP